MTEKTASNSADFLTTSEVARLLSVNVSTVGEWIDRGKLKGFKTLGGHRRVLRAEFMAFLRTHSFPSVPDMPASQRSVLIVDDEALDRLMFRRIVEKISPTIAIHEATNGYAAGKMVAGLHPSLVILDLQLPGLDGVQVCRDIRDDANLTGVKVLATSGHLTTEAKSNFENAGANAVVSKSQDRDELRAIIDCLLASREAQ